MTSVRAMQQLSSVGSVGLLRVVGSVDAQRTHRSRRHSMTPSVRSGPVDSGPFASGLHAEPLRRCWGRPEGDGRPCSVPALHRSHTAPTPLSRVVYREGR
uniref:Uncharacterized protein n=1 Tax=Ixodes scapularis TaxID=6945 RepID=A0A4D5RVB1_IXOSC